MKKLKILRQILHQTRADEILFGFIGFLLLTALAVFLLEPSIHSYRDALWYCYEVITTIGFGDEVTTRLIPRCFSVILSIYATLVIAIITGVVVNFYTELINRRRDETFTAFMDKLEQLPDLSKEELEELSKQVAEFRMKRK